MKKLLTLLKSIIVSIGCAILSSSCTNAPSSITIVDLTCNYMERPLGIDTEIPKLSWKMISNERNQFQTAYQIIVASAIKTLNEEEADLWNSGKIDSDNNLFISYGGKPLSSKTSYFWKVRVWDQDDKVSDWSTVGTWSMGFLEQTEWQAKWIGWDKPCPINGVDPEYQLLPARMLRKEFWVEKKIKRATAYICGLGLFEMSINGNRIGEQVLAPALTDYSKRAYYMTFDIAKNLNQGVNAVGIILGNGRYHAPRINKPEKMTNYGYPKMIAEFEIEYADGSKSLYCSDDSWRLTTDGPIIENNAFDGEVYDATKELKGWDLPGYDDSAWNAVELVNPGTPNLRGTVQESMVIKETIIPKSVKEVSPGIYIFDMGQNMVGWVSLKVKGKRGTKVTMRFGETLKADGNLYTDNLRGAKARNTYICSGKEDGKYKPKFTYFGFRYVELSGYPGKPDLSTLTAEVIYDDLNTIGNFKTSNETINGIYKNAYWGIRGNYRTIPTDCPQRDERMGWLGDRTVGAKGESFIFNNHNLYAKWLDDINDSQLENGCLSDVAPAYWRFYSGNVTWPAAYMFVADMLYEQYGDIRSITKHYESFKKWLNYLKREHFKNGIIDFDTYGDWCMPPEEITMIHSQDPNRKTTAAVLGTSYYYHLVQMIQKFATLTNNETDRKEYAKLAALIKQNYNQKYFNKDKKCYDNNTATANLLALSFGLVPDGLEKEVFKNVELTIENDFAGHICTGLIGAQHIMRMLTKYGRADLALSLTTQTDYPSWGYMLSQGATTIWELWNGNTANPAMNSGNHVMLLGDLMIWYYENLGGIKSTSPGFKNFSIAPLFLQELSFVEADFKSPYGIIKSHYKFENGHLQMIVSVPVNTKASVAFPSLSLSNIYENSVPIEDIKEVKFLKVEGDKSYFEIGSGNYFFTINQ